MRERWEDIIVQTVTRFVVPFMQLYALYVLAHGHSSPGGGFQGGCIFAASLVLLTVARGAEETRRRMPWKVNIALCAAGVGLYAGIGGLCMSLGGNFLDYGRLSDVLGTDHVMARYYGMAGIETGVQITVMAIMVAIFLELLGREGNGS